MVDCDWLVTSLPCKTVQVVALLLVLSSNKSTVNVRALQDKAACKELHVQTRTSDTFHFECLKFGSVCSTRVMVTKECYRKVIAVVTKPQSGSRNTDICQSSGNAGFYWKFESELPMLFSKAVL